MIKKLNKLIGETPETIFYMGKALCKAKKYKIAVRELKRAVNYKPKKIQYLNELGKALILAKDF